MILKTPLSEVLKTTKDHIESLHEMGLETVEDLLLYFPKSYEDLSQSQTIATAPLETKVTIQGEVEGIKLIHTRNKKQLVTAIFTDTEGNHAEVIWFNQPHIKRMIKDGDSVVLTGKLIENGMRLQMQSPTFERSGERPLVHSGKLVPVYAQHDRITTTWLREKMVLLKDATSSLEENLPLEVLEEEHLLSRSESIRALHFPKNGEEIERAQERMAYEQMYFMQIEALERKQEWQGEKQERLRTPMDIELIKAFFASLQFTPTDSQRIAIYEILKDMEADRAMSRLLEGDVGSGKTLVATAVMANTLRHRGQCALMVPTEVLARQHTESISRTLINFYTFLQNEHKKNPATPYPKITHPSVALLTGSLPKAESQAIKQGVAAGTTDIVIGTHALLTEDVRFHDLKLVIVDEQHRFGVVQRETLKSKGNPHFLSMTATPIPRTLALTGYGHHDLSVLLEKPGKRQSIATKVVSPSDRKTVELFIDHQISEGRQIFVICPLIESSTSEDMLEVKNVEQEAKRLQESFPRRSIAMLHGRMHPKEKEETMRSFKNKEFDILVSTSVIEVGIDVPNATIILIEGAERFGLAQLHQFRGRVGRGDYKSYCYLFTTTPEQARSIRLKSMEEHDNGFVLAEIDLKIRGPGELFGVRQSGVPEGHFLRLLNPELVVRARRAAQKALSV